MTNHTSPARPPKTVDFTSNGIRIVALNARRLQLLWANQSELFGELGLPDQTFEDAAELVEISKSHCLVEMKKAGSSWPYAARWLAIEAQTGMVVADFMLKSGPDSTGAVEIGYGIHADNAGRGLMTRSIACFLEWARQHSAIKRVKAETNRDNIASIRVLEKNGFRQFAPLPDSIWWEKRV